MVVCLFCQNLLALAPLQPWLVSVVSLKKKKHKRNGLTPEQCTHSKSYVEPHKKDNVTILWGLQNNEDLTGGDANAKLNPGLNLKSGVFL